MQMTVIPCIWPLVIWCCTTPELGVSEHDSAWLIPHSLLLTPLYLRYGHLSYFFSYCEFNNIIYVIRIDCLQTPVCKMFWHMSSRGVGCYIYTLQLFSHFLFCFIFLGLSTYTSIYSDIYWLQQNVFECTQLILRAIIQIVFSTFTFISERDYFQDVQSQPAGLHGHQNWQQAERPYRHATESWYCTTYCRFILLLCIFIHFFHIRLSAFFDSLNLIGAKKLPKFCLSKNIIFM